MGERMTATRHVSFPPASQGPLSSRSSILSMRSYSDSRRSSSTRLHSPFPVNSFLDKRLSHVSETSSVGGGGVHQFTFDLGDPLHSEDSLVGRLRNKAGHVINNGYVQAMMTFLIVFNAILLGVLTLDVIRFNTHVNYILEQLDLAILIAFTVEFGFQFFYLGPVFIRHTWLLFDMLVVVLSWIFMGTAIKVLRAFRIFRVFSLASKWPAMQQLFTAVGNTLPRMVSVLGLLLVLFYAVTVFLTAVYSPLYDDGYLDYPYFGRLDYTFITLFQMLTTDSWLVILRQVMDYSYWAYIIFFTWVALTAIIIINLIVAIICESLIELKADEVDEEAIEASRAFLSTVPLDDLIYQQRDIHQLQMEMEKIIDSLLERLPPTESESLEKPPTPNGTLANGLPPSLEEEKQEVGEEQQPRNISAVTLMGGTF